MAFLAYVASSFFSFLQEFGLDDSRLYALELQEA
jgi:hypothetical protein